MLAWTLQKWSEVELVALYVYRGMYVDNVSNFVNEHLTMGRLAQQRRWISIVGVR
jgi:hypothetical protein